MSVARIRSLRLRLDSLIAAMGVRAHVFRELLRGEQPADATAQEIRDAAAARAVLLEMRAHRPAPPDDYVPGPDYLDQALGLDSVETTVSKVVTIPSRG